MSVNPTVRAEYFALASADSPLPGRYTHLTAAMEHPNSACVLTQCEPCESCTVLGRVWPDDPEAGDPPLGWLHVASHTHPSRWQCAVRWEQHTTAWCRFLKALRDEQETTAS